MMNLPIQAVLVRFRGRDGMLRVENEILCGIATITKPWSATIAANAVLNRILSDENTILCTDCYDKSLYRCSNCETIVHSDDTYWRGIVPIAVNIMTIAV